MENGLSDAPDPLFADRLRDAWRRHSLASGWSLPGDWWVPPVDAVTRAVNTGRGLSPAVEHLGRARARAGVGIGETLEDLGSMFTVLHWKDPPMRLIRVTAEGWADVGLVGMTSAPCEDPLTGLVTLPYLRSRLAEIYREAAIDGTSVDETHCLVVVDLNGNGDPWRRMARTIVVGNNLRETFKGGETLSLVDTGRAAALVPLKPQLELQTAGLRRDLGGNRSARVWIERLPTRHKQAMALLDTLTT